MYFLILLLPLLSALFAGLFGRKLGENGAGIFTTCSILLSSLIAWFIWYEVGLCGSVTYLELGTWMEAGLFQIKYGLLFDSISSTMLILVTTVSGLVHWYSTEYMRGDPHKPRFMSYLSLFTFFMIVLVTSDNYVQLFIGWEGVGLCSYLLINFWYTRIQANKSAMKAMIVNRVGDVGLALGMLVTFKEFKTLDFATIFSLVPSFSNSTIIFLGQEYKTLTVIGILILIGAVGKSAQLGLHTWLPDAMEGPTPVSALIHAATMVTAGVFVLIRSSPLLEFAPTVLVCVTLIGGLTALFAASVGLVQNDIKKVIAYSTCSQLGYMVLACGLSNYATSLFHLVNHGFFVRWYRYFDLLDELSYRDTLKGKKLTYLFSEFEGKNKLYSFNIIKYWQNMKNLIIFCIRDKNGEWKRTFVKNCVIVINFYNLYAKFLQGKRNYNSHCYRFIESTFFLSTIMKQKSNNRIIKILKISKPVIVIDLLQSLLITSIRSKQSFYQAIPKFAQSGCRIDYQANALSNVKDRLLLTGSWDRQISHSCYKAIRHFHSKLNFVVKKQILQDSIYFFPIHINKNELFSNLDYIIPHWIFLLGNTSQAIHCLRNILYKRFFYWAHKKYDVSRTNLYLEHLTTYNTYYKFKLIPLVLKKRSSFDFMRDNLKNEITAYLTKYSSGLSIFYIIDNSLPNFYTGKSENLKRRFMTHVNSTLMLSTKDYKYDSFVNNSYIILDRSLPKEELKTRKDKC